MNKALEIVRRNIIIRLKTNVFDIKIENKFKIEIFNSIISNENMN